MQDVIDNNMLRSYFKHNNASYLQQGGVSSSSRIQRLKYNTLYTNIPSNATNKPIIFYDKLVKTNYKTPEGTRNNFKCRYNPACSINKIVPIDYDPNAVCSFKPKNKFELKYAITEYLKGTLKYGNINNWDTSLIEDMSELFYNNTKFNYDIYKWNTSNVTNMKNMFNGAINFDKNISAWDTSKVLDMSSMFKNTQNFNQNIGNWNTSSVINFTSMFENSIIFNNNIRYWRVESKTILTNMFLGSISMINKYNDISTFGTTPDIMFFNQIEKGKELYPPIFVPYLQIPYPPFSGPPFVIISQPEPEPEPEPSSIDFPGEPIPVALLCKCDNMEFDPNDTTDYTRLPLQVNSLYRNVGYEIYELTNRILNDDNNENEMDYSTYSRLSKLLLDEQCERFEDYESVRNIIVNSLELILHNQNSEQTLEDKIGELQLQIQKMLGEGYVKKNPLDITTATETAAVIRTDYQLYINIYGLPDDGVYDPVKLGQIVKILEDNNIAVDKPLNNVEKISNIEDLRKIKEIAMI